MHRLIRKKPGSKIYVSYSSGFEKEDLRKIGFSGDIEKRKKSYVSSGNLLNIISYRSWCDKVDESIFQSFFQSDSYDHARYKPKKRLKDVFNKEIEDSFNRVGLDKVHCKVFSTFINLIETKSIDINNNLFYLFNKNNNIDLEGLGLDPKLIYSNDYENYSLGVWLYSEPLEIRSVGFWRSVIYKLGKNFDDIIKNSEYLSNQTKSTEVKNLYNIISDKLYCIKRSYSLSGLQKDSVDKVCDLYLSYCCAFDKTIRNKIEDEIFDIINKSGH